MHLGQVATANTHCGVVYATGNLTNIRCAELMLELQRLLGPDDDGKPLQLGMHWYGWNVSKRFWSLLQHLFEQVASPENRFWWL